MSRHLWTPSEVAALEESYSDSPTEVIARAIGCSLSAVYAKAAALGLKKSETYLASPAAQRLRRGGGVGSECRFKTGHKAWNKGMKGLHIGGKETQFKPGCRSGRALALYQPIGTERISKDGYIQVKINDDMPLQNRWRGKHILVWEAANGPLPAGHAVTLLDGNKANCDPENLKLVTRRELMLRNTVHNLPTELKEVIDLKRYITRHINEKEKQRDQHD